MRLTALDLENPSPPPTLARIEPSPLRQKVAGIARGIFSCCNQAVQTCKPLFKLGVGSSLAYLGIIDATFGIVQVVRGISVEKAELVKGGMNFAIGIIQLLGGYKYFQPQSETIRSQFHEVTIDRAKWAAFGGLASLIPGVIVYSKLDALLPFNVSEVQKIAFEALTQTTSSLLFGGIASVSILLLVKLVATIHLRRQDAQRSADLQAPLMDPAIRDT